MAQNEYFLLSNFGVRYFKLDYTDSSTVPSSATASDEITGVISCNIGGFEKSNTKYRTLNGSGWESVAPLGQSTNDGEFSCVREGTGGVYTGSAGSTTYTRMKDWFMSAAKVGGKTAPACIIEVVPRGGSADEEYEGTCYYSIPNAWTPGTKDTETGQEYSFSVSVFGPQVPLKVTYSGETDTFTFTK